MHARYVWLTTILVEQLVENCMSTGHCPDAPSRHEACFIDIAAQLAMSTDIQATSVILHEHNQCHPTFYRAKDAQSVSVSETPMTSTGATKHVSPTSPPNLQYNDNRLP
ncbi:unnamed protein product [Phytophthora fragariaefolia]|uniref:Unnamed protein product n=1 Tax=Phytophthora fragariaefolia TaxID=1490495 RepID=A0A9W7D9P5_9STRA|nr:unnamed protein product [Phytophthora fragariaefolia]